MRRFDINNSENRALEMARYRVRKMRKFYTHLFIYVIVILVYVAKRYFGAPFNFWPFHFIDWFFMTVWTFIIAIQGIKLFFRESVFGTDWEQRKIQEFLKKDKQSKWE